MEVSETGSHYSIVNSFLNEFIILFISFYCSFDIWMPSYGAQCPFTIRAAERTDKARSVGGCSVWLDKGRISGKTNKRK